MAIVIKGAFDHVSHQGILDGLAETNCGERLYNYVRSFLNQRTAEIKFGAVEIKTFKAPNKGTPQGAVISPTLFNVVMIGLERKLQAIPGIQHTLYYGYGPHPDKNLSKEEQVMALVWCVTGSLREKEERLQAAACVIETYVRARGLQCAAEK